MSFNFFANSSATWSVPDNKPLLQKLEHQIHLGVDLNDASLYARPPHDPHYDVLLLVVLQKLAEAEHDLLEPLQDATVKQLVLLLHALEHGLDAVKATVDVLARALGVLHLLAQALDLLQRIGLASRLAHLVLSSTVVELEYRCIVGSPKMGQRCPSTDPSRVVHRMQASENSKSACTTL